MTRWSEDLISVESARTLDGLFAQRVKRSPNHLAYRYYDRSTKSWIAYNWAQMAELVARWQQALASEQLRPGERVALMLRNAPEWVMFDQASLSLGLVVVPLYMDDRPDNVAYILQEAEVQLLLVQDAGRWRRLASAVGENSTLKRVLVLDPGTDATVVKQSDQLVRAVESWLPASQSRFRTRTGDPHELASIIYTSGTTGRSKGVMLTHYNMLTVAHSSISMIGCYQQDVFLSFLPLSHTMERTAGYYLPIMSGSCVGYARSIGQLAEDLQVIKPTILVAVPRIFERIYGRLKDQIDSGPLFARILFELTVSIGWRRFLRMQGRDRWRPTQLLWPLLNRLVASKLQARLGDRVRTALSGGAALSPSVAKVFIGLGIPLLQGYGLTETSPVVSVNRLEDNIPASVGMPIAGVKVKIGKEDELLVKSPGLMLGYWNDQAATNRAIDSDGWFHTGDQARIENNRIYITGRIKDILVLSNGEKLPPEDMELAILLDPLFEQVMVVGEGRAYLSALVVLNSDHWPGFSQACGLDPMDPASLVAQKVVSMVQARIKEALKGFPGYAKIRRVTLLLKPWTVENGLLTPTMKVKRAKILEQFNEKIEKMYVGGPAGSYTP